MGNIPSLNEIFSIQLKLAQDVIPVLNSLWVFFLAWGWIFLPFLLWPVVAHHWLFWRNIMWAKKNPSTLLEIRIPEEVTKPIRAMETVFAGVWQLYGPPNWFEKWWEGQFDLSFSLEIVSIEGVPHFLIRIPEKQKGLFMQHIYAQYPEAEITEVEDYTQKVPQNIPSERWDIWGTDYTMPKSDCYPLKSYRDFETEHEPTEEKRIDPMAALMEGLSQLERGEQIWIQIRAKPVTDAESGFQKRAKKEYEKLAGRKGKSPAPPLLHQALNTLTGYPKIEPPKKEENPMVEMMLTPGEKEVVSSIEKKMKKQFFECFIRYVYVAQKEKFTGRRVKIPMSYFNQFNNPGFGFMIPWGETITKVKKNWYDWFWIVKRRLYLRKRKMFRNYIRRETAFFPLSKKGETFVLNTEELATIYHFPSRFAAPPSVIPRVGAKKKEAPSNLPTE